MQVDVRLSQLQWETGIEYKYIYKPFKFTAKTTSYNIK